ncbi:TonB-dependent receptor [Zhongshania sp. BJYM1]|uniref:TonB-dependent receptor n=1 Tax=Zhongshania aquatica TaxID=2965069 RepID=UPI0022B506BF|nr:TonB-dependent receptor [Marortus sp. BJYM1]
MNYYPSNKLFRAGVAAGCLCASFVAPVSHAQNTTQVVLEEVIVTARKTEESLKDVPSAVSAINADSMKGMGLNTVADIGNVVPGLRINSDGDSRAFVQIRGIGITLQTPIQPGVGFFMDGIYVPYTSAVNNNLLDTAQVEVIRGPQGTLFGKNTLGGAINVISKEPTEELSGEVSTRWAEADDSVGLSARVSGTIIDDKLLGSVAVARDESDGFFKHRTVGGGWDARESSAIKSAFKWFVGNDGVLRFNASYGEYEGPGVAYTPVPNNDTDASNFDGDSRNSFQTESLAKITRINGTYNAPITERTDLALTLGYDKRDLTETQDRDFVNPDILRGNGNIDEDFLQSEIRLETQFTDDFRLMYAAFYSEQSNADTGRTDVIPAAMSTFATRDVDDKTYSVYANAFWSFAESWELSGGLRYDKIKQEGTLSSSAGTLDRSNAITYKLDESPVSPMVSLKKYWSDDLMTYATAAKGVRAGGFNGGAVPSGFETFDGDEVKSFELGFKSTLAEGRATLNMAVFFVEHEDIILNDLVPDENNQLVVVNRNQGSLENWGVEGEFKILLSSSWQLGAGLSYISTDITDDPTGTFAAFNNEALLFQPEWTANLTAAYSKDIGVGRLESMLGVFYTGKQYASGTEAPSFTRAPELDASVVGNLSADYIIGNVSVGIFANNITDEDYWSSYIGESVLSAIGFEQAIGVKAAPRNIGLRASYSF